MDTDEAELDTVEAELGMDEAELDMDVAGLDTAAAELGMDVEAASADIDCWLSAAGTETLEKKIEVEKDQDKALEQERKDCHPNNGHLHHCDCDCRRCANECSRRSVQSRNAERINMAKNATLIRPSPPGSEVGL